MTGVTLFGTGTAAAVGSSSPGLGLVGDDGKGSGTVMVKQQQQQGRGQDGVRIVVDKTEDDAVLDSADFWSQFDYVLVEDRREVVGGQWDTVGVVKGYGGIEVVKPGREQDDDWMEKGAPRVVGLGETVALWKRKVRALTGGWWVGPRMVERIYILRRVKEAPTAQAAVEAK
jgi:alpha-1,6-mannosyltransferase